MFKTGKTKLPLASVKKLAEAISVDPGALLRLTMAEYMPEAWDAMESILGNSNLVTQSEVELIRIIREGAGNRPLDPNDPENRRDLQALAERLAKRDDAKAQAAVARINALPSNARHKGP